jgi:hypothetical protein
MAGLLGRAHLWYCRQGRRGASALTITGPIAFANGVNLELLILASMEGPTLSRRYFPHSATRPHHLKVRELLCFRTSCIDSSRGCDPNLMANSAMDLPHRPVANLGYSRNSLVKQDIVVLNSH